VQNGLCKYRKRERGTKREGERENEIKCCAIYKDLPSAGNPFKVHIQIQWEYV